MEVLLKDNGIISEWVFIINLFIFCYFGIINVQFGKQFNLILRAVISQKSSNQFLRETNSKLISILLLPIFILVLSLVMSHPLVNDATSWQWSNFAFFSFIISIFFLAKIILVKFTGFLFEKPSFFDVALFHAFLVEIVGGVVLFPFVILSIYSNFDQQVLTKLTLYLFVILFILKWVRTIYLSFFKSSISKTHLIVYLCLLEFLPFILFITMFF